jgi:hypothetical protein
VKTARLWLLLSLVAASRIVSFLLLKSDPPYVLVPRSIVGGGFQVRPALLDLLVPAVVILSLWPVRYSGESPSRSWRHAFTDAACLLLFPVAAALSLFAYGALWHVSLDLTTTALLRWLQFVGAYVAWNMMLDQALRKSRWQRVAVVAILFLGFGPLQDAFPGVEEPIFVILFSVGVVLALTVFAFRRRYLHSPVVAISVAAIVGAICCLLVIGGVSESLFTSYLPVLAIFLGALTIRSPRWLSRWVALTSIIAVGLLLSLWFPRLFPPPERANLLGREPAPIHAEVIDGITVRYADVGVRPVAIRLAHVLAAANEISEETYGISPQVNELVIRAFEEGGFHAEFPHEIVGNLPSQQYADRCLDHSFLNDPRLSINFPDPVNAILHEYSHLYGVVFYSPWLGGPEEEGWATLSATRLSRRLYERFGGGLWNPPYDYAALADQITKSNLAGHPVFWSHANEYGGFRLWYRLGKRDGEVALYRKRWALTRRDYAGWWYQINDPGYARRMASGFGLADFIAFGSGSVARYDQVYTLRDAQADELLGVSADEIRAMYSKRASELIDPTIKVPKQKNVALDISVSLLVVVAFAAIRFAARPPRDMRPRPNRQERMAV